MKQFSFVASRFLVVAFIAFLFSSCDNDFNINDEWENITVVYGILDPAEPINYIRINKAFLGVGDIYQMAQVSDSLQYPTTLDVRLERYQNNTLLQTIILSDTVIPKNQTNQYGQPGIFATNNNIVYYTKQAILPGFRYKLRINGSMIPEEVWSETNLLDPAGFQISLPTPSVPPKIPFEEYNHDFTFRWKSIPNGRIYQIIVRFHYSETIGLNTVNKSIDWILTPDYSRTTAGNENMTKSVKVIDFYQTLVSQIPEAHGEVRAPLYVDFMFYVGHEDLNIYIQLSKPSTSVVQERPSYTNIHNGVGVFSCRVNKNIEKRLLTVRTIDSIANGKYTKKLGFTNH